MDRERFNTLLSDPSLVTNTDIKALNEYRKKYPYFQSLYVIIAKALKDRKHAKTAAFVNKTAAYSVNREYLNEILEGTFSFPKKAAVPTPTEKPTPEKPAHEIHTPEISTLDNDAAEIKATKERIEALLASTDSATSKVEDKKKPLAVSQVEIIEKFIKEEPSIERQKLSASELPSHQEDLASKAIKGVDAFETETLAQLMAMQGKHKKAIIIYKKLSLKFPEKSTYFAGRIEEIKSKKNV